MGRLLQLLLLIIKTQGHHRRRHPMKAARRSAASHSQVLLGLRRARRRLVEAAVGGVLQRPALPGASLLRRRLCFFLWRLRQRDDVLLLGGCSSAVIAGPRGRLLVAGEAVPQRADLRGREAAQHVDAAEVGQLQPDEDEQVEVVQRQQRHPAQQLDHHLSVQQRVRHRDDPVPEPEGAPLRAALHAERAQRGVDGHGVADVQRAEAADEGGCEEEGQAGGQRGAVDQVLRQQPRGALAQQAQGDERAQQRGALRLGARCCRGAALELVAGAQVRAQRHQRRGEHRLQPAKGQQHPERAKKEHLVGVRQQAA
mmetsp:Transcript_3682/g.9329  ORF Transcript_3682/g.9329 Transcript_3682/m.9329 type:complete len:312 (+) Transcript_3682:376-1311(+)